MREVCKHLGLDPAALPETVERKNAGEQTWRSRDIHPLWRVAASFAPARTLIRAVTPSDWRGRLRDKTRPQTEAKGRFRLTPEEESRLIDTLTPDLRRLKDRYGFDVKGEWGIDL